MKRIDFNWKSGELNYCLNLVVTHGDTNVGHGPSAIKSYLLLQSHDAARDNEQGIADILQMLHDSYESYRDLCRVLSKSLGRLAT